MSQYCLPALCGLLLTVGCTTKTATPTPHTPAAGLSSLVQYGQGDCMPVIDESRRVYQPYTGELYLVQKAALDQLGAGSWQQLQSTSLHYSVSNGQLRVTPPADTYVVMPAGIYLYTADNTLTIQAGQGVSKDFKFWKCLSY